MGLGLGMVDFVWLWIDFGFEDLEVLSFEIVSFFGLGA